MESKANYTIVGLVIVILTAALISVSLWLSVGFDKKHYVIYAVYMSEAVSGLNDDSAVKFNGVQVGRVKQIQLDRTNPQRVRLLLAIESKIPITTSTRATLISQGITGNTYVGLIANTSDLRPLVKGPHDKYPIIPTSPSIFNQLDKVLKDVSVNVNDVSKEVKKIFDDENAKNIAKTLHNLSVLSDVVARNKSNIDASFKDAHLLLKNVAKARRDLPGITKELHVSIKKINRMATQMADAAGKVSNTMDSGKLTIDKISQQTIPPIVTLVNQLNSIAANIEIISQQMRQNPSVIIRGISPPKPGPGE